MAAFHLSFSSSRLLPLAVSAGLVLAANLWAAAPGSPEHPGAVIYKRLCLECHGAKGEGVAGKYEEPLHGDRTIEALGKRIDRTMPEDNEEACNAEESALVAAYIHEAFYSPEAQARNNPAQKDLSRLTVAQYQTSITDLIGRFRPGFDRPPGLERGLKAKYSGFSFPEGDPKLVGPPVSAKQEKPDRKRHRFERVDGPVAFQFHGNSPDPQSLTSDEFSVRWDGSFIAPDTGTYEFVTKSQNGVRLYINDRENPVIDAWVSSGPEVREEKASVYLLGGRTYSLSLEFFKYREQSASIQLWWKTPHGVLELIPKNSLLPGGQQDGLVITTAFPPDDRSEGYERGTGVSKSWDQSTTDGAIEVAEYVDRQLDRLAGTKAGAPDRVEKLKDFCRRFAEAAFRRPLTEEQKQRFIEAPFQKAPTPDLAVKRVVLFTLKSPRFLYPELRESDQIDDHTIAARLALTLWDSIPDTRLAKAAAEGKLRTKEQISGEARRMLADARTKTKLKGFFHHWLELDRAAAIAKDPKKFPGFDETVQADLRTSLWMFVDQVVWSEKSDYRELLQADYLWMNERLARFYGTQAPPNQEFQQVKFDPGQRTGVVTHPYLLAAFAYSKDSSPIHRGVFLTRNIVGMSLKSPPMAIEFEDSHFDPKLTMREKVTSMTKDKSCMACHSVINPLGFSLEHYDAVGRWRTKDNDRPVDAIGEFANETGRTIKLQGARDIATYAATSESGHRAFIRHLFHHTVKQPVAAFGQDTLETMRKNFEASGFNIQKLLLEIVLTATNDGQPKPGPVTAQAPARPSSPTPPSP